MNFISMYKNVRRYMVPVIILLLASFFIYFLVKDILHRTGDLAGDVSTLVYIKDSLINFHTFPLWNPFYNQGLPIIADPLSNFLNPFILIPVLLFPFNFAINFILFFSIFFSGITYYIFAKANKVTLINATFFSVIYLSSGYLLSRIVAGHFELIVSYCLVPLFYLFLTKIILEQKLKWTYVLSIIVSLFLFSGAAYLYYYSFIIIFSSMLYFLVAYAVSKRKNYGMKIILLIFTLIETILFSSVKLFPMLQGNGLFVKSLIPYTGSENLLQIFSNLFIPLNLQSFYSGFIASKDYFWWESYAFIGPAVLTGIFLFIYNYKKYKFYLKDYYLYLIIVGLLFIMSANILSPFHWLIHYIDIMQKFRIPTRFFIFIIPILLLISSISLDAFLKRFRDKKTRMCYFIFIVIAIASNYYFFYCIFTNKQLANINKNYDSIIAYLKKADSENNFYVAQNVLFKNKLPLYNLVFNGQKILNANYGFILGNSSTSNYVNLDFKRKEKITYNGIYPKYFIYPCSITPPPLFNANILVKSKNACLYKGASFTPFVYITPAQITTPEKIKSDNSNIKITMEPNNIIINAYAKDSNLILNVMESYYPGWQATVNGEKANILKGDYISVKMLKGNSIYSFKFDSFLFRLGLFVTMTSLLLSAISLKLINNKHKFGI